MAEDAQWWWCLTHERAEQGPAEVHENRLGPYPTEAAARDWRSRHEAREEAWSAQDEDEEDDDW